MLAPNTSMELRSPPSGGIGLGLPAIKRAAPYCPSPPGLIGPATGGAGKVIGMTSYMNIVAATPRVEIGSTWNPAPATERSGTLWSFPSLSTSGRWSATGWRLDWPGRARG